MSATGKGSFVITKKLFKSKKYYKTTVTVDILTDKPYHYVSLPVLNRDLQTLGALGRIFVGKCKKLTHAELLDTLERLSIDRPFILKDWNDLQCDYRDEPDDKPGFGGIQYDEDGVFLKDEACTREEDGRTSVHHGRKQTDFEMHDQIFDRTPSQHEWNRKLIDDVVARLSQLSEDEDAEEILDDRWPPEPIFPNRHNG